MGNRDDQQPIVDESVDDPKGKLLDRALSMKMVEVRKVRRIRSNLLQCRIHGYSKSDGRLYASFCVPVERLVEIAASPGKEVNR